MFAKFLNDDLGAVTVDWTLLTAMLVGLAIAVIAMLSTAAQQSSNALNSTLSTDVVGAHDSFD